MKNRQWDKLTTIEAICDDEYNASGIKKMEEVSKWCIIIGLILFFSIIVFIRFGYQEKENEKQTVE